MNIYGIRETATEIEMNVYGISETTHKSVRFYVNPKNKGMMDFLETVCMWGNYDHEINGLVGFEVKEEIWRSVNNILIEFFDGKNDDKILL